MEFEEDVAVIPSVLSGNALFAICLDGKKTRVIGVAQLGAVVVANDRWEERNTLLPQMK